MGTPLRVLAVAACAAIIGQIAHLGALAPLLVVGVLVVANTAMLRWRSWQHLGRTFSPRWFTGPLATCWLLITLLPMHQFSHRPITGDGPEIRAETFIELLAYVLAGLVALSVVRTLEPTLDAARPPVALLVYPTWITITCLWSATAPYALVRGMQMITTGFLAWATIAVARVDRASLDEVIDAFLRWFVRTSLVLVALGVAFGPVYVLVSADNAGRFTWVGAHPLAAGLVLAAATVIAATAPARVLRLPTWARWGALAVFVGALVPNHSRHSWFALAVLLLVGVGIVGRHARLVRWVGAPLLGAVAVAGTWLRGEELWGYLLRDNDASTFATGNGRLQLWGIGMGHLETSFDWTFGLGFGVTRTLFVDEVPWARTAHNSLLAVLVSAGVVGVCLFGLLVYRTVREVIAARTWLALDTGLCLTLLLLLVLINGVVSDNLAIPNFGLAVLYLVAAAAIGHRVAPSTTAQREALGLADGAVPTPAAAR